MKTLLTLLAAGCVTANAQWVVTDPKVLLEMIRNGRISIEQLKIAKDVKDVVGNPASIRFVAGLDPTLAELGRRVIYIAIDKTEEKLEDIITGKGGLDFNGIYHGVQEIIQLPDGSRVLRAVENYKPYEAIHRAAENAETVLANIKRRRKQLLDAVADTAEQVRRATTQAEIMKLHAVATTQTAALAALAKEQDEATAKVTLREIQNRNDQQRQEKARIEDRAAEFGFAQRTLNRKMKIDSGPSQLPVHR